jgi:intein/homing endonuclease
MYIWRGRNRRDTRHISTLGEEGWIARNDEYNRNNDDEVLRCSLEKKHIDYFHNRIQELMSNYLETEKGKKEIELLRKGIEKYRKTNENYLKNDEIISFRQNIIYENIKNIFKSFSLPENDLVIDVHGLHDMLEFLGVKMKEKQFLSYCKELNMSENFPTASFDDFYLRKIISLLFSVVF